MGSGVANEPDDGLSIFQREFRGHRPARSNEVRYQSLVRVDHAFVLGQVALLVSLSITRHTSGPRPSVCGSTWNTM